MKKNHSDTKSKFIFENSLDNYNFNLFREKSEFNDYSNYDVKNNDN